MEGWVKKKSAARYAGVSVRTFDTWLKRGLRHVRLPSGTILIRRKWIDSYLIQFEKSKTDRVQVDELVDGVISELKL